MMTSKLSSFICKVPPFIVLHHHLVASTGDRSWGDVSPRDIFSGGDVPPKILRRKKNNRETKEKERKIKKNSKIVHRQVSSIG